MLFTCTNRRQVLGKTAREVPGKIKEEPHPQIRVNSVFSVSVEDLGEMSPAC